MKKFWKFVKTSGVYFVGTILQKTITFFLLPIYTKYISPKDMGTYDLHLAYITFLCSVLFLNIWCGIMRYTFEYTDEEKKKPITSGVAIFLCSTVLYTIVFAVVWKVGNVPYLGWIYLYGILSNIQTLLGYLTRCFGKNFLYAISGLASSFVTILFNIIFIVTVGMDYSALFISSCIGFVVGIVVMGKGVHITHYVSKKAFDKKLFKRLFVFSIPLCFNSVAFWFLTAYSRVAISNILGEAENGMYAIAGRFSSFITLFTTCFNMAWQEIAYYTEANDNKDRKNFYTQAINYYIRFLGVGFLLLLPVICIIYPFFIDESYAAAKVFVPLYLLGTIASAISEFLGEIFTAININRYLFWTTVISGIINVVSIHLLLPVLGVQGASIALLVGFLVNTIVRLFILRKKISICLDIKFIGVFVILVGVAINIYNRGAIVINIIYFICMACIALYMFKDILVQIINSVKNKRQVQ